MACTEPPQADLENLLNIRLLPSPQPIVVFSAVGITQCFAMGTLKCGPQPLELEFFFIFPAMK